MTGNYVITVEWIVVMMSQFHIPVKYSERKVITLDQSPLISGAYNEFS